MIHIFLPKTTTEDIVRLLSSQLETIQKEGAINSSETLHNTMTLDTTPDGHATTFLDDEPIASGTYLTSPHLESAPHAYIITVPIFSTATFGLTLLASQHLRWTITIPKTSIPTWVPDSLRKSLLNPIPPITRSSLNRLAPAKDTCTIHTKEFRDMLTSTAYGFFRATIILTIHRH